MEDSFDWRKNYIKTFLERDLPSLGFSFEGHIIENIIDLYPKHEPYFFKTAKGDEVDLLLVKGLEKIVFEIKASTVPQLEEGFWRSLEIIKPWETYIIANIQTPYLYKKDIWVHSLESFTQEKLGLINSQT